MRILVSGGGVSGLTLAYWLNRHGHTPVVVERTPHGSYGGYGIDFFGSGYDVASRMGIVDQLVDRQVPAKSIAYVDGNGRVSARLERRLLEQIIRGPYLALLHSTLDEALTELVRDEVEIRYDSRIAGIRQHGTGVDVVFADGAEESFDLLIGADGVHSKTRELVFGPERQFARNLGYLLACYPVEDVYRLGPVRTHYNEPGRLAALYGTGVPGEAVALFVFRSDDRHVPRAERPAKLRAALGGMGWLVPQLCAAAPEDEIFMDTLTQIHLPTWYRGRVALIGDACGAMTMASAQGASLAMAGGYLLAEALRDHTDPGAAFAAYERRVRPPVVRRQRRARGFAKAVAPASRAGLAAQRLGARALLHQPLAGLLRLGYGDTTSILPPS
ncbi:FAD-dependent monooxygenase [Amycolatopsis anabasis]|uniref:FAD-dependent monooxygenase n=1 Tax=Amycolatopsis anabasis TaxID=1840409 RepID=UPI00131C402C|nr:FAD-dependent monooxygenase [Amycolatopsis anabasis]